ncbi:BrnT family toxin [Candidatus Poribacteria bacterium]|nr:BrnT family toxin [Candidatus Poribacteria bacterium]
MPQFEWDENKNQENIQGHGISFERAKTIFNGIVYTDVDDRYNYGEVREKSIGLMEGMVVVVVIHTDRNGLIRIISARKANKQERRDYYAYAGTYY